MKLNFLPAPVSLHKIDWIKLLKLMIGTTAAILLAHLLQLQYAYAAGIITLLTIQDTKRETLQIALKRLIIFIVMTLLSVLVFPIFGYTILSFTIILIPYLFLCLLLEMKEAIAPIAVLCTHYISAGSCSLSMIGNESGILIVGAGIGILLNFFFTNNLSSVRKEQFLIEERIKAILKKMAIYITREDKSLYTNECFTQLEQLLDQLKTDSLRYMNNHFLGQNDYFYEYMNLRLAQCRLLKRIYTDITRIDMIPSQSQPISEFLSQMADEFHERNNALDLLTRLSQLNALFDQELLPSSREEFRNRALLYHILKDLEEFVELKRIFFTTHIV